MFDQFAQVIRAFFWEKPNYLILYPTSRCNARCRHCYNSQRIKAALSGKSKELTLREYEKISNNLGGVYALSISGGEPTLRLGVPQICHLFYKNNQTRYIDFHSNGYLTNCLVTMVEKILKDNPQLFLSVCVSIDALGEKHNRFRGLPNGFEKAMESIEKLKALRKKYPQRLILKTATSFAASTQDDFEKTLQFLSQQGIEASSALVRGKTWRKGEEKVDVEKYVEVMKRHLKNSFRYPFFSKAFWFAKVSRFLPDLIWETYRKKKQIFPCWAGRALMVIYDNGDLAPCELFDQTIGNIRDFDYNLLKAFKSPKAKKILTSIRKGECYCTWENMLIVNCLKSFWFYPKLASEIIKSPFK